MNWVMNPKLSPQRFFDKLGDCVQILTALEHLPGAMFMIKDSHSRYVYMSRELQRAIRLPEDDNIFGKTDFDLFPRIVAERFRQNDQLVLQEGKTLLNEIHAAIFFDAPAAWHLSSKWPLRDSRGRIIGLITTNQPYSDVMGKDDDLNRLLPALDIITKRFGENLTIQQLANACRLSSSHFMRLFRERLGTTAHSFLEQMRMQQAILALKHTSQSIAIIALRCGFYDHSSFVTKFKKLTGNTPLKFRREHRDSIITNHPSALPTWPKPSN